ncbi:D-alanyl-D-alanine carboxypeptidase family protein [Allorhizobium taibaishanense]|uniref:serine-type D-Ala-D-Ala carboxypeptidase n=1 Tax=Allorhizobium taibaishanense TaxID=887144 RepID=A0A7W6MUC4_9HYPH|nr:D-alanyl-D-alanine carboxypeptidase family protein [Allorhizobium taibaishanense]MBB4007969.1 D-alanyl-D-alanine carboxypeptidase (penicillin-binding protein 5/6) [Allorhizobium taibaishanense]
MRLDWPVTKRSRKRRGFGPIGQLGSISVRFTVFAIGYALTFLFALNVLTAPALAQAAAPDASTPAVFATEAKQVLLIEAETGSVLFEKNSEQPFTSASLSKMMVADVVLEALKAGRLSLTQDFPVSESAWRTGGAPSRTATMFAAVRSRVPVDALLKGVMVQMANDACLILAEGMTGSEQGFVKLMNERAVQLGLKDSHFANATGLPDPGNKVTLRDMLTLAQAIRTDYPDFYKLYAQPDFEWNKIFQRNRNPLLGVSPGVDGLAAGFTEGEGYSIIASAEQNGVRLYLGLAGSESDKTRQDDAAKALAWGFSAFEKRRLFDAGQVIGQASVYGGEPAEVPLVSPQPVDVYVPVGSGEKVEARVVYRWPLRPGIETGAEVARLKVMLGDRMLRDLPLQAAARSDLGSLVKRTRDALVELLFSWV